MSAAFQKQDPRPFAPESLWIATTPDTNYPLMPEGIEVDVAIIGAGMVGITVAYMLKQAGRRVAVIEADRIVKGTTGHTTAKITSLHHLIYHHLVRSFGKDQARQYADANQAAIETIAALVRKEGISCDFTRSPVFTTAEASDNLEMVKQEVEAAQSLGLPASFDSNVPLPPGARGAIRFDNQARFHPRKYLLALASKVPGNGSHVFEQTRVVEVQHGEPCIVGTGNGKLRARDVVIATNFPILNRSGFYFARLSVSRSYAVAVRTDARFPEGMYINSEEPARSFRSQPYQGGQLIIIADGAHPAGHGGDTNERYLKLEEYARKLYNVPSVEYCWSTQDPVTIDKVPYIGNLTEGEPHFFVATGFRQWGMTSSTVSALIIADMIQGRPNRWAEVFDPSRFKPLTSGKKFIEQNIHVVGDFVSGLVPAGDDIARLQAGQGGLVRAKGEVIAAYRNGQGSTYRLKPFCTHMGCRLTWNNAERSWDCPCHGSRFNYDGRVIHSPAVTDLGRAA